METPPGIRFSGTIKESADGAETPKEDTHRNIGNDRQPGLVLPKRGTRSKEAHTSRYLASWPVEEHDSAFRKVCGAKGVAAVSPGNRAWLSPMVLQSTQEAS